MKVRYHDDTRLVAMANIRLEEFRTFVEKTENELYNLFISIDNDKNGQLDKAELRVAFKRAGLAVPNSRLDQFFEEVDGNRDVCTKNITCVQDAELYLGLHKLR